MTGPSAWKLGVTGTEVILSPKTAIKIIKLIKYMKQQFSKHRTLGNWSSDLWETGTQQGKSSDSPRLLSGESFLSAVQGGEAQAKLSRLPELKKRQSCKSRETANVARICTIKFWGGERYTENPGSLRRVSIEGSQEPCHWSAHAWEENIQG